MANNLGPQQFHLTDERTQQMEPSSKVEPQAVMANHFVSLQFPQTNQKAPYMHPPPSVHIQPALAYNLASLQHPQAIKRAAPSSVPKLKPTIHNNISTQQLPAANKRTLPMEPSPKAQSQSFESVRSKLRESLAAALALVGQTQNSASDGEKMPQNESASVSIQGETNASLADSGSAGVNISASSMPERSSGTMISTDSNLDKILIEGKGSLHENIVNENKVEVPKTWACEQEFQSKHIFPEDASFIIKDDLLQGNGLCWASDLNIRSYETDITRNSKRPKLDHQTEVLQGNSENLAECPETLAAKIEEELFKFYGGVNKKYKEKGRSLLFNLKDRNNPELRERVMSGEIPPEKLCTMTAEELASKELSEWRIAKAEELAQMVVLPDAEVDIRRLVRKTHKGEFQVEIEQDDSVSVEVAIGESSLAKIPFKNSEIETQKPRKINETEVAAKVDSCPDNVITLTQDSTDLMEGLVVEDELKDTDFLPPIVSLDEFMDSLNAEPPFENLPVNTEKPATVAADSSIEDEKQGFTERKMDSLTSSSGETVNISKANSITKADVKRQKNDNVQKSLRVAKESERGPGDDGNKIDHMWEGVLQFNVSSVVTVVGTYKSGEKTSTKEWANFLEIKGRVRLDAFGKFLQELPLSKSRAVMIGQFTWKEGSPESGRLNLSEAAESYISDERLGIAEPAPGVELYLCPPYKKTVEMLYNLLPKDHDREILETIDSGLIGIVVWRRANMSSNISPKASSHHKQNSRKHSSSIKTQRHEDNAGRANQSSSILGAAPFDNIKTTEDEEDVPPGFGPHVAKEEDLPEFEFGRGSNFTKSPSQNSGRGSMPVQSRQPTRPVEQMRELVHRYGGQIEAPVGPDVWGPSPGRVHGQGLRVETQPWNEEDDDIPEWRPHEESQTQQLSVMPNPTSSLHPSAPRQQQHMYPIGVTAQSQAQQAMLHVPFQHVAPQAAQLGGQVNGDAPWQHVRLWQQPYGTNSNPGVGIQAGVTPPSLGGSTINGPFYRSPGTNWRPRYP